MSINNPQRVNNPPDKQKEEEMIKQQEQRDKEKFHPGRRRDADLEKEDLENPEERDDM